MKRFGALFITTIMLLALAGTVSGCHTSDNVRSSVKIGLTVYDREDTFIREICHSLALQSRLREQAQQVAVTILQESANGNQAVQNNQVEGFIQADCDILCVNLVDRTDASHIIDLAVESGLPVLFFNREPVEEDLNRGSHLYYIGAHALESGQLQGQAVAELYRDNPAALDKNGDGQVRYVMLEGEAGHQDAIVRTESAIATAAKGGVPLVRLEDEIADWVRAQAKTKMTNWLESYGETIELVFANNDDMALGAIDALKLSDISREGWPVVVGIDGTSVGLAAVKSGDMTATVYNDAHGQASGIMDLIFALVFNDDMPAQMDGRYLRLPHRLITAANVGDYLK